MVLPRAFWRRALSVFFCIQAISLHQLLVASLSLQHNSAHSSGIGIDSNSHGQQEEHNSLLPAFCGIRLKFYTTKTIPVTSESIKQEHLFLRRLDGIELYGREIVHTACDAKLATMSTIVVAKDDDVASKDESWDVTLLLRPDSVAFHETAPIWLQSKSCFVAMNRFQVKEDCKALFEERWSQRNSKLSYQPGFVGFSLLRKRTSSNIGSEIDRFNYSTCTIWDSIESWKQWRNGGGRTSHEASNKTTRVPVSEWLEGPSSPIFWDGTTLSPFAANGTHADNEKSKSPFAFRR